LILKDPPATLDMVSSRNGRGSSIELLNVLQIVDINQVPAFLYPTFVMFVANMPETYQWSAKTLMNAQVGTIGIVNPNEINTRQ
jgi:hypothetical protein